MMDITHDLIRATVSANAYAAAQAYVRAGRVRALQADPEHNRISAKVQGSASKPYAQMIEIGASRAGKPVVHGDCTCPVGFNCKHVAAVLMAHRAASAPAVPAPQPDASEDDRWQMREIGNVGGKRIFALQQAPERITAPAPAETAGPVLAPALAAWLHGLEADAAADSEDYPEGVYKRLFYMLSQQKQTATGAPLLHVALVSADVKRDGTISQNHSNPNAYQLMHGATIPKYLRPSDRAILPLVNGTTLDERGGNPEQALRQIFATGRARVGSFPGIEAREGAARDGALEWLMEPDGAQRPALSVPAGGVAFLLPAPWYIDTATGEIGTLNIGVPPLLLRRLLNAPPVLPGQVAMVREALAEKLPTMNLPVPRELPHGGKLAGKPVPHIRLRRLADTNYYDFERRFGGADVTLSFRYGPVLVPPGHAETELVHEGERFELVRHVSAEASAHAILSKTGFVPLRRALPWGSVPGDRDRLVPKTENPAGAWMDFMLASLPMLRGLGWEVAIDEDFPHRLIEPTGPMHAELREGSGIDWFDFDLGVLVGEERVDLAPALVAMLSRAEHLPMLRSLRNQEVEAGRKLVLPLPDGRRIALELASIKSMLLTLLDLFSGGGIETKHGRLTVSRHNAAEMAALEQAGLAAGLVWRGGEALRALGRQLHDRGGIGEAAVPDWFAASLRPYQQRGVDWLQFLREAGLAGVLADDMGLGKTVQTLAHLAIEKQAGRLTAPALVICPTSVVGNWAREAERFTPQLRVLPLQGSDRKERFGRIAESDLVISTYPLMTRDYDVLTAQDWHTVILDEAQTVKNPGASMAQAVRQLRAGQRICLTGTPMENHLGELWALFDFMMPGFLGSQQDFGRRFRTPVEKGGDAAVHAALAKRVAPFLLRRNKSEVAADLPPRTEIVENVQMQAPQRAVYEAIRMAMHARVQQAIAEQGLAKSGIVILDALLKMRQACCDPRLLKISGTTAKKAGSAKLERLMELLTTLLEEGRSILLFSQFTSMLALIEEALKPLGIEYVMLTGDTVDRRKPVDRFQAGRVKLFLISLKAGGVGLNLTAADTVIHYDPWWNPAVENQATDRAHRIGQTKSVFVHRLITENSIEEKMEVLKARKSALAEGILSGAGANALRMTEDDVAMLFS